MSSSLGAVLLMLAAAQQPSLHRRDSPGQSGGTTQSTIASGHTDLPPAAEGEYRWGKLGEEIELYFDGGRVHGYLTERADPRDDQSPPLTFDFATSHADGHALSWITRAVHGSWWIFKGHVERGLVASPMQPGYFLLTGTLAEHFANGSVSSRTVSLSREPGNP